MDTLALKIRLSMLWLMGIVWAVAGMTLMFFEIGFMEGILAGEVKGTPITQDLLFALAIVNVFPLAMAFLSLTLKDKANRWANIIVGIVATGMSLIELAANLGKGLLQNNFLLRNIHEKNWNVVFG